jgi:microcystin-dependent protein
MATPFLGEIRMFGGNFAPVNWAMCAGQLMAIDQNTALFAVLGTIYGGDGVTTFALPDLQGRTPLHWGTGLGLSNYQIGQKAGVENTSLLVNNMPSHTHTVKCDGTQGGQPGPTNNVLGTVNATAAEKIYSNAAATATMNPAMIGPAGQNIPFGIQQPYLCITFIIALQGIFPSQN